MASHGKPHGLPWLAMKPHGLETPRLSVGHDAVSNAHGKCRGTDDGNRRQCHGPCHFKLHGKPQGEARQHPRQVTASPVASATATHGKPHGICHGNTHGE